MSNNKHMKRIFLLALLPICGYAAANGKTLRVEFSELGLQETNLQHLSPIALNEDIQISFALGSAMTPPSYNMTTGRVTVTMGSTITIGGLQDDVRITSVSFISPKASSTFSNGSAQCQPAGTFTIDKEAFSSTWTGDTGAPNLQITNTMGSPVLTSMKVVYTGGTGTGTGDDPDPIIPDPVVSTNTFSAPMDTRASFDQLTIINTDEASYTWQYDKSNQAAYIRNDFETTASLPKDDYLVTPPLNLKSGLSYRLDFTAWCGAAAYPEKIEALLGTECSPGALVTPIVAPTLLSGENRRRLSSLFTVPADGDYYASLHACSDPGMFLIYASDFNISRGVAAGAPTEIADFTATADPGGAPKVSLSLTAPSNDMQGNPLTHLKSVDLYRGTTQIATLSCTPGQRLAFEDTLEAAGTYRYTAVAEGDAGKGFDAVATVWVGSARPASPETLTVMETAPGILDFQWEPVTTNIHGNVIDSSSLTYTITANGLTNEVATGLTGDHATIQYPAEGMPQEITDFTIRAVNAAGISASGATTEAIAVGRPYNLPYAENFPGGMLTEGQTAQTIADEDHAAALWAYFELLILDDILPVLPDGGMMAFWPYEAGDVSTWISGKIEIPSDVYNPCLSFFYYTLPGASDKIQVGVNGEPVEEFTIGGAQREWVEKIFPMEAFKGQTVRISLTGTSVDSNNKICIDNISLKSEPLHDMSILRARIPQEMIQGANHTCSFRIGNKGVLPSGPYTLVVKDDGKVVDYWEGTTLERGETAEFTLELQSPAFDRTEATYTVELICEDDENTSDNLSVVPCKLTSVGLPAATIKSVEKEATSFIIGWEAPDFSTSGPRDITESFESYDEFEINRAGEWSFIDGDGCNVIGIRDGYHEYPNMFAPMAFMVFNNHDGFFTQIGTQTYDAYEGGQCMMSAAVDIINTVDRFNDDWMISPLLSGRAQKISFYARSSGRVFPETISVKASSTDCNRYSFSNVALFPNLPFEWTRFEAELPEGTTRFAICNESYDQFMLFVDNVSFEAAPASSQIVGYTLYLSSHADEEWSLLQELPSTVTSCEIPATEEGRYVKIGTRFENGCETFSSPMKIGESGITQPDFEEEAKDIYDLNGLRLTQRPKGIYIQSGKKRTGQ